jgi:hypothetical protein
LLPAVLLQIPSNNMSSADIDKTLDLDSRMKSAGEVIRPASTIDLDSCDSLEPKAKGKRKREVRFYHYLDTKLKLN